MTLAIKRIYYKRYGTPVNAGIPTGYKRFASLITVRAVKDALARLVKDGVRSIIVSRHNSLYASRSFDWHIFTSK